MYFNSSSVIISKVEVIHNFSSITKMANLLTHKIMATIVKKAKQKQTLRASLVVQWLRICLPMQGTWVRALVWEDPTCRAATGPVSHNY